MQVKAAVRTMLFVMTDVAVKYSAEMPLVHDEQPVGALRTHRSHPALGDGV
jgi:hypothetical protein